MKKTAMRFVLLLAATLLGLLPHPARAIDPTLNTILDIALQEMAPELKPAKPLIVCLIDGGSIETCVKSLLGQVTAAAKAQTEAEAKKALTEAKKNLPFDPEGPEVKLVVEIVLAAKDGNWGVVIGKGGPYLARAVVCAVFVPPGVKSFACPVIGYVIEHQAGLVKQVIDKLAGPDIPGLVKLLLAEFGPETVCELIPDSVLPEGTSVLKDLGCGVVGKILGGTLKLADAIANLAIEGADELLDLATGGNDFMPYDDYYTKYWRPGYHYATWLCLDTNGACKYPSGQGLWEMHQKAVYASCKTYYDEHDHWEEDAAKVCKNMLTVFDSEVKKIAAAMQAAAQVFASEQAPKWAKSWAPEDWGKPTSLDRKEQFLQLCTNAMQAKFPFPAGKQPPVTAWARACKAPAEKFAAEYAAAQKQVAETIDKLGALGCKKAGLASAPKISCATYEGFEACKSAHEGKLPCALDTKSADAALAGKILQQLGTKRCKIVDEVKSLPCPKQDGTWGTCPQHEKNIVCSRPWKVDQCKALLAQLAAGNPASTVRCQGDVAGLAEFAKLAGEAASLRNKLNGGSGVIGTQEGFGDVKAKAGAGMGSCKAGDPDTLKIHCPGGEFAAHPEIVLSACPPDPNLDGADAPCRLETFKAGAVPEAAPGGFFQGPAPGGSKPPTALPPAALTPALPPPPVMSAPPVPVAPPPAAGSAVRPAVPPAMAAPPVLAPPPAETGRATPVTNVPGCTPVAGAPGQYACATREAHAGCERLRTSGSMGIRACSASGERPKR